MSKIKDGKIVVAKNKADEYFKPLMEAPVGPNTSRFDVPTVVRRQIEDAGYEMRFINEQKYVKDSNHHERDWLPYTPELFDESKPTGVGLSPDGRLRRGDCVLAIRPKARGDQYRAILRERNRAYARKAASSQQVVKEEARRAGFGVESIDE